MLRNLKVFFLSVYCGICHTDVVYAENKRGNTKFPLVPGHELAGIVTKVSVVVKKVYSAIGN
jgi:D-arabinose 1-dehydrogenase-like Zn-dependent alcohol dehydrogenase